MTAWFTAGVGTAYVGTTTIVLVADSKIDERLVAAVAGGAELAEVVELLASRPDAGALSFAHDDAALLLARRGRVSIQIDGRPFSSGVGEGWHRHRTLVGSCASTAITMALDRHALPFVGLHRIAAGVVPASAVRSAFGPLHDSFDPVDALLCPTTVTGGRAADHEFATAAEHPVGVLVFATGERVLLDRTVVLGRNPHPERQLTPDVARRPRLVRVSAPGVSRQHALVRVEDRRLVLHDLGSANGTHVTEPGAATRTVLPGVPLTLTSGAVVELGVGVSFTVEDLA